MRASVYVGGIAVTVGVGAALLTGSAVASADDATGSPASSASSARPSPGKAHRSPARAATPAVRTIAARSQDRRPAPPATAHSARPAARSAETVSAPTRLSSTVTVTLPPMPVVKGWSFTVSPDFMNGFAGNYVAAGGDPADSARFFFGDLAVASLDALAQDQIQPQQVRSLLGNLAASGYFGGIWLRDNLSGTATVSLPQIVPPAFDLSPAAIGIRLFDALATGLTAAAEADPWLVTTVAHASVPLLLALYGYNRGYLDVVLEHPPAGVPSMQDTLSCQGFLACNSTAFPLELATRYDGALGKLDAPTNLGWAEMAMWTTVLQSATGAGRFVWEGLAQAGFSPVSYTALVDLSSAYLMVTKAAVLASMTAYADGDAAVGRSSLRLQAGLWMWSGAYFAGLASGAPAGTLPSIMLS